MMVMVAKGYDLDYAGRAVGQAYRCAVLGQERYVHDVH
jgi:hypothetical protein